MYRLMMECKIMSCLKLFIISFSTSLQNSVFLQKYFNEEVWGNYRYGVSYWDRLNKTLSDLMKFNSTLLKRWKKCQQLNQKLSLLADCYNSA